MGAVFYPRVAWGRIAAAVGRSLESSDEDRTVYEHVSLPPG